MGFYTVDPTLLPNLLLNRSTTVDPYAANHLYTDPLIATNLPTLLLEAAFGAFISTDSDGAILPAMELSSRMGSVMTGLLSTPSLSATASRPTLMSLSAKFPALELSSRTGARGGDLKLPAMELSISANGYIVGKLSVSMPGLSISATGHTTTPMSLDQDLPPLKLTISMNGRVAGNLSEMLSALKITAEGRPNEYGTLSESLPRGEHDAQRQDCDPNHAACRVGLHGNRIGVYGLEREQVHRLRSAVCEIDALFQSQRGMVHNTDRQGCGLQPRTP